MAGRRPPPAPPAFLGRSIRQFTHEQLVEFVGLVSRWLLQLSRYVYDAYTGLSAAHAPTHLPSGSDPLTTDTPVSIGMTNAEGGAESFSLSDHVHATPLTTKGDLMTVASSALAKVAVGTDTHVLTADSAQTAGIKWAANAAAPTSLAFVTIGNTASLSAERALTGTANQVVVTDNGANSTVVLSTPQNIHTGASPEFAGMSITGTLAFSTGGGEPILQREAANVLAMRNGANNQTLELYTNYTDASNYERLRIAELSGSGTLIIQEELGTGTSRSLTLASKNSNITFRTANTDHWQISATRFGAASDNGTDADIGGNGAGRPRTIYAATSMVLQSASNGAAWTNAYATELVTIAAAATSDSAANLLPANAIIESVVIRVTVAPPGTATFNLGDATTATRFATGVSTTINTTNVSIDQWLGSVTTAAAGPTQAAAAKIRITPNANPSDATGRIRVTVFYRTYTPPSS